MTYLIATREEGLARAARAIADWLGLAAAPTFAAMALLEALGGDGPLDALCASALPISGMVPMYLLMSAFHLAPWLRLFAETALSERGSPR